MPDIVKVFCSTDILPMSGLNSNPPTIVEGL